MLIRLISLTITMMFLVGCSKTQHSNYVHPLPNVEALDTYYDYQLYDTSSQQLISDTNILAGLLKDSSVVLFGEFHSQPAIHLAQLRLLQSLHAQEQQISLSMEQFDRSQQTLLDNYLANEIGEAWLIKQSKAWDNYRSDYRPLVEFSKSKHLNVVAANAPRSHVNCIGREGLGYLDKLNQQERKYLAKSFTVNDPDYQQRLFGNAHHGDSQQSNNHFLAMLAWDETMAESIAYQLKDKDTQQVMHVVGNFHIEQRQGTYSRVQQRLPKAKISSIVAVNEQDFSELSAEQKHAKGDYLIVVLALPIRYQQAENRKAEYQHINQLSNKQCKSIN